MWNKITKIDLSERRTGKTIRLLLKANKTHGIVVEPNEGMVNIAKKMAKARGLEDVVIINYSDSLIFCRGYSNPIYIDNFDIILESIVVGLVSKVGFDIREISMTDNLRIFNNNLSITKKE